MSSKSAGRTCAPLETSDATGDESSYPSDALVVVGCAAAATAAVAIVSGAA